MRIAIAILFVPAAAAAEPRVELGLAIGGHEFSRASELGVTTAPTDPSVESGVLFGVRLGVPIAFDRLAVEGEALMIPSRDTVMRDAAMVFGLRAHARFDLLRGRVRPFVVAGAGYHALLAASPKMSDDIDPELHWGGGVRWAKSDRVELRVDARQLIVPSRAHGGATTEYEATAGVTLRFGGAKPPIVAAVAPMPPPVVVVVAPPAAPPAPPPAPPIEEKLAEIVGVGFERDSAMLDSQSRPILDRAVAILATHASVEVEISGHTSVEGDAAHNLALSLARAEAVRAYLVEHGIASSRLHAIGHGAEQPLADNRTEEGRRRNRRIEFRVLPKE
jgi:OOP family OmpA-OmpF porin